MVRAVVVGQEEVSQLAKDLISKGEKPTIGRIRELLGNRGSPNTISRYLKTWREGEIEHIRHGEHDLFAAESDSESHAKSDDDVAKKKVTDVSADAVSPVLNSDANISRQPVKKAAPAAAVLAVEVENTSAQAPSSGLATSQAEIKTPQGETPAAMVNSTKSPLVEGSPSQVLTQEAGAAGHSSPHQPKAVASPQHQGSSQSSAPVQVHTQNTGHHQASSSSGSQNFRGPKPPQGSGNQNQNQNQNQNGQSSKPNHQKSGHQQKQGQNHHHKNHDKAHDHRDNRDNRENRPHVPKPALMFEDNFPNVYVSENLDTLTSTQLIAKVRRLESILNKEQSRRESADSMARDAKEYAEAVKVQVGARINDIRQSMEMVIDSLQSQIKSMRENAEKDLRFYRESLEKAKEKLAQQKINSRNGSF